MEEVCALAVDLNDIQHQHSQPAPLTAPLILPTDASSPAPPSPPAKEPWVLPPEMYEGDLVLSSSFLLQCNLVIYQQPFSYAMDKERIAYLMGLLQGKALARATALWEEPVNLDELIKLYFCVDNRIRKRQREKSRWSVSVSSTSWIPIPPMTTGADNCRDSLSEAQTSRDEPMQLGRFWLLVTNVR